MSEGVSCRRLQARAIAPDSFRPYGQAIAAAPDGKPYDSTDAQLHLSNGTPRFYIMRLYNQGRQFHCITRHSQCTQCLGSLEGKEWFIAVAPPSESDTPDLEKLAAFRIPGNCFIKLERGTWHAGPYFDEEAVDFYNLELSNTNEIDHFTYDFRERDRLAFEIVD